ncbi:MAG: ABC transporter permease [Acidimicrobiia bacterium]|nr:ABC transporter permease [Acidimicrobiia bacterium]
MSPGATGLPLVFASLSLVGISLVLAWRIGLNISRDVVIAGARATVQLLGVGLLFTFIFQSTSAIWLAWIWVAAMVIIATAVVRRRAELPIQRLLLVAAMAILATAGISIAVTFGFGVFDYEPVALVVVAGITIGNAVPSAVLAVDQSMNLSRDRVGDLEAALALGFDRKQIVRFMSQRAARSALIPQVERTKVVGLIALPGAMTGLLLAGIEPVEAVSIQLLVMFLVLGTAAVCVVTLVTAVTAASVTEDLRVSDWVVTRN